MHRNKVGQPHPHDDRQTMWNGELRRGLDGMAEAMPVVEQVPATAIELVILYVHPLDLEAGAGSPIHCGGITAIKAGNRSWISAPEHARPACAT